jgi:DNA-directed RNA polymerase subunit RPC12/RpoP
MGAIIPLVILGIVLVAGAAFVVIRIRSRPKETVFLYFKCNRCKRRLKYKESQAGHKGKCPQCSNTLTFPIPPPRPKK